MDFNAFCEAHGFDPTALTPQQRQALQAAWRDSLPVAEAVDDAGGPAAVLGLTQAQAGRLAAGAGVPVAAMLDQAREAGAGAFRAEALRVAAIQRVCGTRHLELAEQAIRENWTAERAELDVLRRDRPAVNSLVGGGSPMGPGVVWECAIQMALGRATVERDYQPEVLEQARRFRGVGLQQVILMAAAQNGYAASPGTRIHAGNVREVLMYALPRPVAGGASTHTLGGILGNVANKEILAGYVEEDMVWKEVAATKPVSNFLQHTSYRMLDDMEYEELGPDGRIRHGSTNEESFTRQAKLYAKMGAISLVQIVNDDLGAFDDMKTRIGRGSNKKLNKVFWTAFLDNAAFFTAALTNYIEGATTNLGTDGVGLGLGVKAFRTMKTTSAGSPKRVGAGGNRPDRLLVGPSLEGAAEALYVNQNLGGVKTSDANIYANKYRPVVAWQIEDAGYAGSSATAWYLFGNPAVRAPMVVSFLNGQESPTVEEAEADFDQLGIQLRGYHGFGCDKAEKLSGVKSKGGA